MKKNINLIIITLLIASIFMFSTSLLAQTINEYLLVKAEYPIMVNNTLYHDELPLLNYQGFTYVPLRAMSDLLGVDINWNEGLNRVEITRETLSPQNNAFRNIIVNGSNGSYSVIGEARIFEATLSYEIEDGHILYLEGFETSEKGAPEWGLFRIDIDIPENSLPTNGTLILNLFELSAKDGSRVNELPIVLETFLP